jgi:selenide,water dikinase
VNTEHYEDAAVLRLPEGKAMVQSVDLLTPVVNDPYRFGRIAAANALSDIYAMGADPWCAMNIVCFPLKTMQEEILHEILRGGSDILAEAETSLAGGHSVEDTEIKFGMSVTGFVDPNRIAVNSALRPGDCLFLTKPLGTGVLSTAVKAQWEGSETFEDEIFRWAGRPQKGAAYAIQTLGIKAATDITGFGLVGHGLEMARASNVSIILYANALPFMENAANLANMGLVPVGAYANRSFCAKQIHVDPDIDPAISDLAFDPQTSGGMLLAVRPGQRQALFDTLKEFNDTAWEIGQALEMDPSRPGTPLLTLVSR